MILNVAPVNHVRLGEAVYEPFRWLGPAMNYPGANGFCTRTPS